MRIRRPKMTIKTLEDFMLRVEKHPNGCWLWTGYKMHKGYGQTSFQHEGWRTHRLSYFLHYGDFDRSLLVCHKCDVPACVNPEHLFLGTSSDNRRDMVKKGRSRSRSTKLTEEIVRLIREMGQFESHRQVAKQLGLSPSTVFSVIKGKIWQHVHRNQSETLPETKE